MAFRSLLPVFLCSLALLAATGKSSSAPKGNVAQGKAQYQQECAACHNGGLVGPDLTGIFKRKLLKSAKRTPVSEASIRALITDGGESMPPFASLRTNQLDDLIAYLKTL